MNPITDINFWLYGGSLISTTAIALFAIKSGYFDKRLMDLYETITKLIEFREEIDRIYKEIYGESISKSDYNSEYGDLTLVKELPKISEVDLLDLISLWKMEDRESVTKLMTNMEERILRYFDERFSLYFTPDVIKKIVKKHIDLNYVNKYIVLIPTYDVATTVIESKKDEYKLIESQKKKFKRIFSDERIIYLFGIGIVIQLLSLVATPIFIIKFVSFSLAMVIAIKCMDQYDEIYPFYEMVVNEEDEINKEIGKASK